MSLPFLRFHPGPRILGLLLCCCSVGAAEPAAPAKPNPLEAGFLNPPHEAHPYVWWHWITSNITKAGIDADLTDMKRVGIAGVQMFDGDGRIPQGPVRYNSDLWHEHVQYAIHRAAELGLDFTVVNAAGWSATAGPWVTPERSMKQMVWSEGDVSGGSVEVRVPRPLTRLGFYRDIAVLAVPADAPAAVSSSSLRFAGENGSDAPVCTYRGAHAAGGQASRSRSAAGEIITLKFDQPVPISELRLSFSTVPAPFEVDGSIEYSADGTNFKKGGDFRQVDVGGVDSQLILTFNSAPARIVRIGVSGLARGGSAASVLTALSVGNPPRVGNLNAKIKWADGSVLPEEADSESSSLRAIAPEQVIRLDGRLGPDGMLRAELPAGRWTILRFGFTTTASTNHPAVPEGKGLEIDKLDPAQVYFHFDQVLARILREAGPLVGKTLKGWVFDSFEAGFQNWTAAFPEKFTALNGYDFLPYLPVLTGRVVRSSAITEGALADFRRTIIEGIAKDYFGTFQQIAHRDGMIIYSEPQGGPLDPMVCGEYVDVPMNEFWMPDAAPRYARIKTATSISHLDGDRITGDESFTATPENGKWQDTPASLKRAGDFAFATGVNRFMFHTYVHQPFDYAPGFTLSRYGTHFGRLNTWWPYAGDWIGYLARSQFLLQQGRNVADVCFLLNEDFGYAYPQGMVRTPPGFDFDICYPNHLQRMTCRDGLITLQTGPRYRVLVVPKAWNADLSALIKLKSLIEDGATVSGEPPLGPEGLLDNTRNRAEFDRVVTEIWGPANRPARGMRTLGAGKVYRGMELAEVLKRERIVPDVGWPVGANSPDFRFTHRLTDQGDVYFVYNHSAQSVAADFAFRVAGRQPELWDALARTMRDAPVSHPSSGATVVPLQLEPYGSTFVVFRRPNGPRWTDSLVLDGEAQLETRGGRVLAPTGHTVTVGFSDGTRKNISTGGAAADLPLPGPWKVSFQNGRGAPAHAEFAQLSSWTENSDPGIKYFSGTAAYETTFNLAAAPVGRQTAILDLGAVDDLAEVRVNGRVVAVVWQPPFRIDVTGFVRAGDNALEIRVTDRWINRLIGDEQIPVPYRYKNTGSKFEKGALLDFPDWLYDPSKLGEKKRITFATWQHYSADSPLVPAGLLGPVALEWRQALDSSDLSP